VVTFGCFIHTREKFWDDSILIHKHKHENVKSIISNIEMGAALAPIAATAVGTIGGPLVSKLLDKVFGDGIDKMPSHHRKKHVKKMIMHELMNHPEVQKHIKKAYGVVPFGGHLPSIGHRRQKVIVARGLLDWVKRIYKHVSPIIRKGHDFYKKNKHIINPVVDHLGNEFDKATSKHLPPLYNIAKSGSKYVAPFAKNLANHIHNKLSEPGGSGINKRNARKMLKRSKHHNIKKQGGDVQNTLTPGPLP